MGKEIPPPLPPPPVVVEPPVIPTPRRPGVVMLYRIWCALFVVLYVSFGVVKVLEARGTIEPHFSLLEEFSSLNDKAMRDQLIAEKRAKAPGLVAFVLSIALLYTAAAMIPRKPWAWVFGIVVLATTVFPFCVTAAAMVPLLVHWLRPEVKQYFGRPPR